MDLKYGDRPRGNILDAFGAWYRTRARVSYGIVQVSLFRFVVFLFVAFPPSVFAHAKRYFAGFSRAVNANAGHTQYGLDLLVSVVTKLFI